VGRGGQRLFEGIRPNRAGRIEYSNEGAGCAGGSVATGRVTQLDGAQQRSQIMSHLEGAGGFLRSLQPPYWSTLKIKPGPSGWELDTRLSI